MDSFYGDVIHTYTRAEAIADGSLIDLTNFKHAGEKRALVQHVGFKCPVAMTSEAYAEISLPPEYSGYQSVTGRLWDLLSVLLLKIRSSRSTNEIHFEVIIFDDETQKQNLVKFKAHAGPGDQGELVITIMLPHED